MDISTEGIIMLSEHRKAPEEPAGPWHADHGTVVGFARILIAAEWLTEPAEVVDYFDKPSKWDNEFQLWNRAGRPSPDRDAEAWGALLAGPFGDQ